MHSSRSFDQPVFDDDFVRAARVQEASGEARVLRAREIAAAHRQTTPWRAPAECPRGPRRRHLRDIGKGVLTLAVVLVGLWLVDRSELASRVPDPVNAWATGAPTVPVPPDAAEAPLGVAAPAPAGKGGYAFLYEHGGRPVAFDPCRPVHYVLRAGAPAGAEQLVAQAFGSLSAATGLVFVSDGTTDEAPAPKRPPHQRDRYGDRWAPVLVAWSTAEQDPELAGTVAGYAGPVIVDPDGRGPRMVTGQVVIDMTPGDPTSQRSILLHELGHLVGLDHVADPADTMHAHSDSGTEYTAGALRGLHQLGAGRCFS